jgi:hypothetical protein
MRFSLNPGSDSEIDHIATIADMEEQHRDF